MENTIDQIAIGELLDGRYFYIPAYQRGYRWTEKQVGDLLRDLLCFADDDKKAAFDFYCLQPIIARPITQEEKVIELFGKEKKDEVLQKGAWEVIDGQQRLTTLFLIFRYLRIKLNLRKDEDLKLYHDGHEEYHLFYATREGSAKFLDELSTESLDVSQEMLLDNIDFYHMGGAFKYIDTWIMTEGKQINKRFNLGGSIPLIWNSLFELLNADRNTKTGSVQVLWYQLDENKESSSIKEFQKINTGKIKLTDAELIKGLFLLDRNFKSGVKIRMSELAMDWEFIENTLHKDSFWYFLQRRGTDMPNRIDLIFSLLYKMDKLRGIEDEKLWDGKLREVDRELQDTSRSTIFRFYNDRFEGKKDTELHNEIFGAWEEVMTLFRMLDDWYCTPSLYNTIGLLSQMGEDLAHLVVKYASLSEESTQNDFKEYLLSRVRFHLSGASIDRDMKRILNDFKHGHGVIFNLLLTLNIHILNQQNSQFESESEVYKFPFDVLNDQDWDIEHIDSFHTNALKKNEEKIEWIKTALADIPNLDEIVKKSAEAKLAGADYDGAIRELKEYAEDPEITEAEKNSIGNLTLLDAGTNRSYGNSLFCTKRRIIIDRMKQGVFVPVGTQYVFYKLFDSTGTNRSSWSKKDMDTYHDFIYEMLEPYLIEKRED